MFSKNPQGQPKKKSGDHQIKESGWAGYQKISSNGIPCEDWGEEGGVSSGTKTAPLFVTNVSASLASLQND